MRGYGRAVPYRAPIEPEGYYHVGSRGTYGIAIVRDDEEREMFLDAYDRVATKFGIQTLTWALKRNHHHFVVKLTAGGLSQAMRELHGPYSRQIHAKYGLTRQGHLFRHGFFANHLPDPEAVFDACRYVDLNGYLPWGRTRREKWSWCGYPALMGWDRPRAFHNTDHLLGLLDDNPKGARTRYRAYVAEEIARRAQLADDVKKPLPSPGRPEFSDFLFGYSPNKGEKFAPIHPRG